MIRIKALAAGMIRSLAEAVRGRRVGADLVSELLGGPQGDTIPSGHGIDGIPCANVRTSPWASLERWPQEVVMEFSGTRCPIGFALAELPSTLRESGRFDAGVSPLRHSNRRHIGARGGLGMW